MTEKYDFIIIGAGGAGLAAAIYGARLGIKTLVLGHSYNSGLPVGGTITMTNLIENYPGFKKTSGLFLSTQLKEQAEAYDLVTIKAEEVISIKKGFFVQTKKAEYFGKAILFATGSKWKTLEVPGAEEYKNKGISYCALCDAPLYKNKIVGIVGGSNTAVNEALILSEYAKKVYLIYRGNKLRAELALINNLKSNVEIIYNTNISEILGDKRRINSVVLDKKYNGKKELSLDGLFIAIGHIYLSNLAKLLGVKTTENNEIIIDFKTGQTNIDGVFAAGDVTNSEFKQFITAVAGGCTSAYSAYKYISNLK